MTYNNKYEYEYTPGFYKFVLTPLGEQLKLKTKTNDLSSAHFCLDKNGTEWNTGGKLGGNAENGNCFGKFKIKDF